MKNYISPIDLDILALKWNLDSEYIKTYLDKYYLLHWSGKYLQSKIFPMGNKFTHQDVEYFVIRMDQDKEINLDKQYLISFRKHRNHSNGYALISEKV